MASSIPATLTMASSTTVILPLTTIFVPPESCVDHVETVPLQTSSGTTFLYHHLGDFNNTVCMPSGWSPSSYFSPGRCPSGYTVATSAISITNDSTTETSGYCCPTGYTYQESLTNASPTSTELCYSSISMYTPFNTAGSTQFGGNEDLVNAYAVSIRWSSEDFSTGPADSHGGRSALSATSKAGIGVGATFAVFTAMTLGAVILLSRRKRGQQQISRHASMQSFNDSDATGEIEKQAGFRDHLSLRSTWSIIELDSWSSEAIAICFSVACFIAIFCVLQIYNGQPKPLLPKGITLNTIVSILATASKSSLMFVAGECIAQLRWVSFRKSRQSLSDVQLYDSASRGPWGSLTILVKYKCHSLVAIGAFIVLLAMAFDPFIQQIIDYPVLPTHRQSKAAKVIQSRYLLPPDNNSKSLTDAVIGGIWSKKIKPEVNCPTGNCTWSSFQSVEMCNKCVNVDPSNVTLSGWDLSSLNHSLHQEQNIQVNISTLGGTPSSFSISVQHHVPDQVMTDEAFYLNVPKYLYWIADASVEYSYPSKSPPTQKDVSELFGFDRPLIVTASAELDLPGEFSTNQSHLQPSLVDAIRVANVTECALAICAREYAITVQNGQSSVKILDEDFGTIYTAPLTESETKGELCWRPSSRPMTNWSTNGWSGQEKPVSVYMEVMDLPNFEFCGVEPGFYYEEMLSLTGTMSWKYGLDIENNSRFSQDGSGTWRNQTSSRIEDLQSSSYTVQRVAYIGLETVMANIASSVSALAREMSNNPIYGIVTTQDSFVTVRWQWLTLPAVLLVAGSLLLIITALASSRRGVRIWKSSTLPLLFHGLEPEFVTRNMMIEHGQCESASEMEHVADGIKVDLGISNEGGRTMLRRASPLSQTPVKRISRRRSF
ncbi:hypothetical protein N7540_006990 [Penicillium herquei]|nr:hypothetical protein N7540_006990 [Penicillium herquei]